MAKSIDYNIRQRGTNYLFVDWKDENGKRQRKALGTTDMRDARKKAKEIVYGARAVGPKTYGITMRDLFDRCRQNIWSEEECRSQATIRSNIKILNTYIGDEAINGIDYHRLAKLKDDLKADGYANGTIHRKMTAIGAALSRACIERYPDGRPWLVGRPPLPQVAKGKSRNRTVTYEEQQAILSAILERHDKQVTRDWLRFYFLVEFLLTTSCRLGEALKMKLTDVEPIEIDGRTIHVMNIPAANAKAGKSRVVLLTKKVYDDLQSLRWRAVKNRFFPISAGTAWYMWDTIRRDVLARGHDISDVVLHSLRHTALTRLSSNGGTLHGVQKWAGHASPVITSQVYIHTSVRDQLPMLDIMEKISGQSESRSGH
jgi:integrase